MDTKIIEYILCIAKNKSIAGAAQEMYLTQSALNQQLLKLERELGAPLFIRMRNRWELTNIGELYIERAEKILDIKNETYKEIMDMSNSLKGIVTIGLPPERGIEMFTAVYPEIHKKYPAITFQPIEADVNTQVKMLLSKRLDFGFQTGPDYSNKQLEYHKILREPFYLCVPAAHFLAGNYSYEAGNYPFISLSFFKDDLFTLVRKTSTMRTITNKLFEEAGFVPKLLFESVSMRSMQRLTAMGQCCAIIPRYYADDSKDIKYFRLGESAGWDLAYVYSKKHYINSAMRDFMELAASYWLEQSSHCHNINLS